MILRLLVIPFCAALFLGVHTVVAHTDMQHGDTALTATVGDVTSGSANLEDFVKHAAAHLSEAGSFAETLGLLSEFRKEGGDWNDGSTSTYFLLLTKGGGLYIHAKNDKTRELEDQDWSRLLLGCSGESWRDLVSGGGGCVMHEGQDGSSGRGYAYALAVPYMPFSNPDEAGERQFVLVGGLDYTPRIDSPATFDAMVDELIDNNVSTLPGADTLSEEELSGPRMHLREVFYEAVTPKINSSDVSDEGDLKQFLQDARTFMTNSFQIQVPLFDPVILRRIFRFDEGPWRSGSTYIYIMDDMGNVIFNGDNRKIEQTNLWDFPPDSEDKFIQRIIAAAKKPGGGFVRYDWNDPDDPNDDPPDGGAGGSSPKLAYAMQFTPKSLNPEDEPRVYVFGTGLYPDNQEQRVGQNERDSGACAISGRADRIQGSAFNLFLVVSVLFLVISFRKRSD